MPPPQASGARGTVPVDVSSERYSINHYRLVTGDLDNRVSSVAVMGM